MRPKRVRNTGKPRSPGSKNRFSAPQRWFLRYLPTRPSGPTTTALLKRVSPARSAIPATIVRRGAARPRPAPGRRPVRDLLGQVEGLLAGGEDVAGVGELRQDDEPRPLLRRLGDEVEAAGHVPLDGAEHRLGLDAGDPIDAFRLHWALLCDLGESRGAAGPAMRPLIGVGGAKNRVFREGAAGDLQADRQAVAVEAAGQRDRPGAR